jgi:hypothetical protein
MYVQFGSIPRVERLPAPALGGTGWEGLGNTFSAASKVNDHPTITLRIAITSPSLPMYSTTQLLIDT